MSTTQWQAESGKTGSVELTKNEKSTITESAESLRENLVINHKDDTGDNDVTCCKEEENVDEVNENDEVDVKPVLNHHNSAVELSSKPDAQNIDPETLKTPATGVTLVKAGAQLYTKITPSHHIPFHQQTSPTSPPLIKQKEDLFSDAQVQDNRNKRLKEDPHLKHLRLQNKPAKAPLLRSTSMPVCVDDDSDFSEGEKPVEDGKSGLITQHRKIYRTGSVSDYTKQRLKTSILMRTSASLVRKPSITDFEMRQIQGEDADSSQSDDEDDDEDDDGDDRFKSVIGSSHDIKEEEICSTTSSSAIDTSCRKDVLNVTTSPCVVSSLPETGVSLVIAMTSA